MKSSSRSIKVVWSFIKKPYYAIRRSHIGKGTIIEKNVLLQNTIVGKYCYIGPNSAYNDTRIGNYCSLAIGVQIGGMEHSYWEVSTSARLSDNCVSGKITTIGNDVWIGAGSIIKQGVTIGNGAVVGANSFVNKDVPPYAIVFGSPAKIFKYRFDEKDIQRIEKTNYWDYKPSVARNILAQLTIK